MADMNRHPPAVPAAPAPVPVTQLLRAWQSGDGDAFGTLLKKVHSELLRMAGSRLRGSETPSLAVSDLLNDALLKVLRSPPDWQNRGHFFATLSLAMRSVLVDHARARQTDRRGGDSQRVTYTLSALGEVSMDADLLTLDALLQRLQREDPRAAQVLQLTYFGGLQRSDIADVMTLSLATVDRELRHARAWLAEQLQRDLEA
jgi:RNA polymerase sigma factor (TIGR02999 family)